MHLSCSRPEIDIGRYIPEALTVHVQHEHFPWTHTSQIHHGHPAPSTQHPAPSIQHQLWVSGLLVGHLTTASGGPTLTRISANSSSSQSAGSFPRRALVGWEGTESWGWVLVTYSPGSCAGHVLQSRMPASGGILTLQNCQGWVQRGMEVQTGVRGGWVGAEGLSGGTRMDWISSLSQRTWYRTISWAMFLQFSSLFILS